MTSCHSEIPSSEDWLEAVQPDSSSLMTSDELAARWRMSPRTLERWRRGKQGPRWVRLKGRVLYRFRDVLAYEDAQLQGQEP